jgi:protein phosphatase
MESAAMTHRGAVRPANEDAIAIDSQVITGDLAAPVRFTLGAAGSHIILIADGMGGHACGGLASNTVISRLVEMQSLLFEPSSCAQALSTVNDDLYHMMQRFPDTLGMGSTVVGAAISGNTLLYFNVGDSRLYLYRERHLVQLSRDDALALGSGAGRKKSHMVTQSLGGRYVRTRIDPLIRGTTVRNGDCLVMCSDGLSDMLSDGSIEAVLHRSIKPLSAVTGLFERAMSAGGSDNISTVVADVGW